MPEEPESLPTSGEMASLLKNVPLATSIAFYHEGRWGIHERKTIEIVKGTFLGHFSDVGDDGSGSGEEGREKGGNQCHRDCPCPFPHGR